MAQLDRFLSVMASSQSDSIDLVSGEPGTLKKDGTARPFTKQPLDDRTVLSLVREIAPPDAQKSIESGSAAAFNYSGADGVVRVRIAQHDGRWQATITPDGVRAVTRTSGAALRDAAVDAVADAAPSATVATPPASAGPWATPAARPRSTTRVDVLSADEAKGKAEIDVLLRLLVAQNASDLHLRVGEPPIIRLHGEMHRLETQPALAREAVDAMLSSIMPERNRGEFEQSNDTDFAYEIAGVARFRANALRDRNGSAGVFRVIPATVVTVEQMGITPEVQNLCQLNKGLVLITGPTGSGKSTTLCALIDLVNRSRTDHVITIEDPIEFVHPNKRCVITQRQVGVHTTSFKSALRAALREDPDIILVGELRDLETVSIAIETAETGHLVFGTLHTTTAAGTVDRVIDQFPADRQDQIRVMLAESLKGVISQTLCKRIGGGRVAAREILLSTPALANLIREGKTFQIPSVMQTSKKLGMATLNDALVDLVDARQVEPREAFLKAVEKPGMLSLLKSHGHSTDFPESGESAAASPRADPPGAAKGAAMAGKAAPAVRR